MAFHKAVRKKVYLKGALMGATHSGKTLGALLLARGLAGDDGRIAVLDTEHGRASHYADNVSKGVDFEFDAQDLEPPFSAERYIAAIGEAREAGYDVLIIDSLSHAWMGEGGLLDFVDRVKGANAFTNGWDKASPIQRRFIDAILRSPMHIICTMRSQMAYELVENDRGKKEPKKIGLKPIQRADVEYEFAFVLDVQRESHVALVTKDVTGAFPEDGVRITVDHGRALREWMEGAAGDLPVDPAQLLRDELADCATGDDLKRWYERAMKTPDADALREAFAKHCQERLGVKPGIAAKQGQLVPIEDAA